MQWIMRSMAWISCWLATVAGASASVFTVVELEDKTLAIPSQFFLGPLPTSMIGDASRLDNQPSLILLSVPVEKLGITATGDGRLEDNIHLGLSSERGHLNDAIAKAWDGRELYQQRVIEYDEARRLYRVYPKSGFPKLWDFFANDPALNQEEVPDHVASCMVNPLKPESADLSNATCKCDVMDGPVGISVTFSGKRIPEVEEIQWGVRKLVTSWVQD